MSHDLVVLFEHPDWQKPLFSVPERRQVRFGRFERVADFLVSQINGAQVGATSDTGSEE